MKIAQVCPRYYPNIGGVETHVKEISERLVDKGHEVEVITTDPTGELEKKDNINGVDVTRFKSFAPGEAYYIAPQIYTYLKRNQYDIIHIHSYHALPAFFTTLAKGKRKLVFTPHYHRKGHTQLRNVLHKFYKIFGNIIFSKSDNIICVSGYEKSLVTSDFNIDSKKIEKIPNGINLEEFRNVKHLDDNDDEKTLLYVGRLEEYKGVQYVIKVLPELPGFKLRIIGKGPYESTLKALAKDLKIDDRIEWLKDVPRDKLLQYYKSADVFIMLSKHEAYGITVAEALASGTPCLVANESALSEFVDDKYCLSIKYPINTKNLISKISIQSEISKNNNLTKFILDWDEVVNNIISIYT